MKNIDESALKLKIETMLPSLNEYQRRRYLCLEAKSLGHGGISIVSRLSGVSRQTLTDGMKELTGNHDPLPLGRCRRAGAGRKSTEESQSGIMDALSSLLEAHTKGDPERPLLWTNRSLRILADGLKDKGYTVSHETVGKLLKKLGYGLQADKKTLTAKPSHPDRNAQFEHINEQCQKAHNEGAPVISIDAKKKENIGNFKNNGQTYQKHKTPIEVLDHDFPVPELGKATPFGIYDIFKNRGFVNVGLSAETAVFAVESIRKWWNTEGVFDYSKLRQIAEEATDIAIDFGNMSYKNLQTKLGRLLKFFIIHQEPANGTKLNIAFSLLSAKTGKAYLLSALLSLWR